MRELSVKQIVPEVARLCQDANFFLCEDVMAALRKGRENEASPVGKEVFDRIIENADIARRDRVPLCQDCGTAVVFLEIGQDLHVVDGPLYDAIHEGVRQGYNEGYLRKSMVTRPFSARVNTKDNTPAVIHSEIVPGDRLKISLMSKGGGAENMSRLATFEPAKGRQGVIDFVLKTVDEAGSNPCPPIIVGVGIGGTIEKALLLAKKSLLRTVGQPNPDKEVAELESELKSKINALGIGPEGFGGSITAMAVQVEVFPCHIASMPVAVNIQCHSARHKEVVL